uniref:NAC domain-containing protein n=1 Tax=Tanacetum cinerariifolium TaxID=118510 RepID=A0A6L2M4Y9_TANCI|nr:NAC domain-containing protein [Tanacetum cinerariifolium]
MKPFDTFLMGDKVISTTTKRENNEFIKSSVDDLILILRESEVISVYDDLECSMPLDSPPSPRFDVLVERKVDIDLPFGEHLDTLSTRDREIDFNHRDIETNDLIPVPRVFDKPLGNSNSMPRSYDVTFSNPLFDFNDDYTSLMRSLRTLVVWTPIPSSESKVHRDSVSVVGNRLPIRMVRSHCLVRTPDVAAFKKVEEISEVEIRLLALSVRTPDVSVV